MDCRRRGGYPPKDQGCQTPVPSSFLPSLLEQLTSLGGERLRQLSGELKMPKMHFPRHEGTQESQTRSCCLVDLQRLEQVVRIRNDQWLLDQPVNEPGQPQYYSHRNPTTSLGRGERSAATDRVSCPLRKLSLWLCDGSPTHTLHS